MTMRDLENGEERNKELSTKKRLILVTGIMLVVLSGGIAFLAFKQGKSGETTTVTTSTTVAPPPNEQAASQTTVQNTILDDADLVNSEDNGSEESVEPVQDDKEDLSEDEQDDDSIDSDRYSSDEETSDISESSADHGDLENDGWDMRVVNFEDFQQPPLTITTSETETHVENGDNRNILYSMLSGGAAHLNSNVLRPIYEATPSLQQVPIPNAAQATDAVNQLYSMLSGGATKLNNVLHPVYDAVPNLQQIPIPDTAQATEKLKQMYSMLFGGAAPTQPTNTLPPGPSSTNVPRIFGPPRPSFIPGQLYGKPMPALDPEQQRVLLALALAANMQNNQAPRGDDDSLDVD